MRFDPSRLPSVLALVFLTGFLSAPPAIFGQTLSSNELFTAIQPCRVIDTRQAGAGGPLAANATREFNMVGVSAAGSLASQGGNPSGCPIPGFSPGGPVVQAVAVNFIAVTPSGAGDLVAWPSDNSRPTSSVINYSATTGTIANGIILPVRQDTQGNDISVSAQVSGTHLVADIVGYFTSLLRGSNIAVNGGGSLTTGQDNTALGLNAIPEVQTSSDNTAVGAISLFNLAAGGGDGNSVLGAFAFNSMTSGDHNIGIGYQTGTFLTSGSYDIYIGVEGSGSVTSESGTIRIGDSAHQDNTFIAGIFNGPAVGGSEVFVTSTGELGTISSSLRFKEDVEDMGSASAALMKLRPVVFHYKPQYDDGSHQLQYGLIAEEVEKVYPDLVIHDSAGLPRAVRYHFLSSMLLNEAQKQRSDLDAQGKTIADQTNKIAQQQAAIVALNTQVDALRLQLEQLATRLGSSSAPPPALP